MKIHHHLAILAIVSGVDARFGRQKPAQDPAVDRIVGGIEATPREYTFMASLQSSPGNIYCGASIIGDQWILTAAHCEASVGDTVVLGAHDVSNVNDPLAERRTVEASYRHKLYNAFTTDYDVAVLKISSPTSFAPVGLDKGTAGLTDHDDTVTVIGWGTTSSGGSVSDELQKVDVRIVDNSECNSAYPDQITQRMLCAAVPEGGKDSCQGDSGGPLVDATGRVQVGIVSWGNGCALKDYPGVYTRVSEVLDFIATVTDGTMNPDLVVDASSSGGGSDYYGGWNDYYAPGDYDWGDYGSFDWGNYDSFDWGDYGSSDWGDYGNFDWGNYDSFDWGDYGSFDWDNYDDNNWGFYGESDFYYGSGDYGWDSSGSDWGYDYGDYYHGGGGEWHWVPDEWREEACARFLQSPPDEAAKVTRDQVFGRHAREENAFDFDQWMETFCATRSSSKGKGKGVRTHPAAPRPRTTPRHLDHAVATAAPGKNPKAALKAMQAKRRKARANKAKRAKQAKQAKHQHGHQPTDDADVKELLQFLWG